MCQKEKILVIEDNPGWAKRLKRILEENNFMVVNATDKKTALKQLETEKFKFATIDLQLDEKTLVDEKFEGWEILKKILDLGLDRKMPTLVLTGFPGDEASNNKIKAIVEYQAGFFMEKSKWDKKQFINTVITAVRGQNDRIH